MSLVYVALAAALQALLKPGELIATAVGGVLGNRSDALFVEAMQGLRQRMRDGNLAEINREVEQASLAALRESIAVFTAEVARRVGGKPPLLAAYLRRKREGTLFQQPLIEFRDFPEHSWFEQLETLVKDDKAVQRLHGRLGLDEDAILSALQQGQGASLIAEHFHKVFGQWLDEHLAHAGRPDCLAEFLREGWPLEAGGCDRISLYQTWHLFFTEQVKHQPAVFNKLVLSLLSHPSHPLEASESELRQAFEAALDLPLTEVRRCLDRIEVKLDLVVATQGEHGATLGRIEKKLDGTQAVPRPADAVAKIDLSRIPNRHDDGVFVGRDAEWDRLSQAWQNPQTRIVALIAIGGAGKTTLAGRWARDLARQAGTVEKAFGWTFYSQGSDTRRQASADYFIRDALRFFGDPALAEAKADAWDKGTRLAELIAAQKTLLVLDGLEPLQHPPGPLGGSLTDPGMKALLERLAVRNPGLCLITSRERIWELEPGEDGASPQWSLDQLSEDAGAQVLRRHGVVGGEAELRQAVVEVKGHALTLALMGRYLKLAFDPPDIARRDCFKFEEADKETANGHAFRVYAAYERWLAGPKQSIWQRLMGAIKPFDAAKSSVRVEPVETRPSTSSGRTVFKGGERKEGQMALELLRLLGLFDRPASPLCLSALRQKPAIRGLTDALSAASDAQWHSAVNRLAGLGLVEKIVWEEPPVYGYGEEDAKAVWDAWKRGGFHHKLGEPRRFQPAANAPPSMIHGLDAHPLLREHFARQLALEQPKAWRKAHRLLYEILCASVPYWPEGSDGLGRLYQAVAHGCRAGRYQETRAKVYHDRIQRGSDGTQAFYSSRKLGLFGPDLAAVACFFAEPWDQPAPDLKPADQAWILNEAAYCLRALNRMAEARSPLRAGLEMQVKQADWESAAAAASNLSQLELLLGEVVAAQAMAAQTVDYAERSGNAFWRMASRAQLADALHQAGQAQAWQRFAEAEALQQERQPDYPLLYGLQGYLYCDGLLAQWECTAARAYLVPGTASLFGVQGLPCVDLAEPAPLGKASLALPIGEATLAAIEQRVMQTLAIASEQLGPLAIGLDHLTLGRVHLCRALLEPAGPAQPPAETHLKQAQTHLDIALAKLREAGDQSFIPRALLPRAWLHALQGEWQAAQNRLDEAYSIATRGGPGGTMRLHLADIHLHRARLFGVADAKPVGAVVNRDGAAHGTQANPASASNRSRLETAPTPRPPAYPWASPAADLAEARRLIERCGYGRRLAELADAELALLGVRATLNEPKG